MVFKTTNGSNMVLLQPESLVECGLMMWLNSRFHGKKVTLNFDTCCDNSGQMIPTFWITESAPSQDKRAQKQYAVNKQSHA
jgi:hypothetical protein